MDNFVIFVLQAMYYSIVPLIEIIILAVLFYYVLHYLRGTRSASILAGIIFVLIALTIAADLLQFEVISWLLNSLWTFFGIALIVIFQPEFRRAFAQLGSRSFLKGIKREETINELITAVINMAGRKHGALIAIEQHIGLKGIVDSATTLEAKLTHRLLETIFHPNTPLHDGGVIVKTGIVKAAHCIFPLSSNREIIKGMGTRHRAALGITEESDALVIIVSEETGNISIAYKGNIKKNLRPDRLRRFLNSLVSREKTLSFKELINDMPDNEERII
jgi:diadenylate cyclase